MKVFKTESGVSVSLILEENSTKTLAFNLPVRSINLTKEELIKIGHSMVRDKKAGITSEIRRMVLDGFFKTPKKFGEIGSLLTQNNIPYIPSSLNTILQKLVNKGELIRIGQIRHYQYSEVK